MMMMMMMMMIGVPSNVVCLFGIGKSQR